MVTAAGPDLVRINLILMIIWAGHETTTGHVSWALIDLLRHPRELDRVRAEQQEVLGGDPPASIREINEIRLLDELVDPDPQPIQGQKTKWPQSPCRVRYQAQRPAARASSSSRLR